MMDAGEQLRQRLTQFIACYWRVPPPYARRLLRVLLRSSCSRVVELRQHVSLAETHYASAWGRVDMDLHHLFAHVLTPRFVVGMLEDLCALKQLTRHDTTAIEECVFRCMSPDGQWKVVQDTVFERV